MTKRRFPGWACCFCFENIPDRGDDSDEPVVIDARGARDRTPQTFYAHLECFKRAMHPRVPVYLPRREDEAEDDEVAGSAR